MPGCKSLVFPLQTRDFRQVFQQEDFAFAKEAFSYFDIDLSNSFLDLFYFIKLKIHFTISRGSLSLYDSDLSTFKCNKLMFDYSFSGSLISYSKWSSPNKGNVSLVTVCGSKGTQMTEVCN